MTVTRADYDAQLAYLVATLEAVENIGRVHDRPRYGDAAEMWIVQTPLPHIRAWEIGIDAPGVNVERLSSNHRHRYRTWSIRGFVGLEDMADHDTSAWAIQEGGSYHLINQLAGDIADAIDADDRWGGACTHADATQIDEPVVIPGLAIGGGHLCWGITLHTVAYTVRKP